MYNFRNETFHRAFSAVELGRACKSSNAEFRKEKWGKGNGETANFESVRDEVARRKERAVVNFIEMVVNKSLTRFSVDH